MVHQICTCINVLAWNQTIQVHPTEQVARKEKDTSLQKFKYYLQDDVLRNIRHASWYVRVLERSHRGQPFTIANNLISV